MDIKRSRDTCKKLRKCFTDRFTGRVKLISNVSKWRVVVHLIYSSQFMWYRRTEVKISLRAINPVVSSFLRSADRILQHRRLLAAYIYIYVNVLKANYWKRLLDKYLNLRYQQKTVKTFFFFVWNEKVNNSRWATADTTCIKYNDPWILFVWRQIRRNNLRSASVSPESERGYGPAFWERLMLPVGREGKRNGSITPFRGTLGIWASPLQQKNDDCIDPFSEG